MNARVRSLALVLLAAPALAAAACADVVGIPTDRYVVGATATGNGRCSGTVSVRILADYTGAISGVYIPYVKGELDYLRELNANGGLRGCLIDIDVQEYGYDVPRAQAAYDGWKARPDWAQVAMVFAAGTNDTLALAPQAQADQKPMLSGSYLGALAAPAPINLEVDVPEVGANFQENAFPTQIRTEGFPYNFFAGTDYSTGGRVAMFHIKTQGGKRVGFAHCTNAYCSGPIPALRSYGRELQLPIGRDLIAELNEDQATYDAKVLAYFQAEKAHKEADPAYEMVDWLWMGNTATTVALLGKAVAAANTALGLNVQIIVNNWGIDEDLFAICGPACVDIVHGILPFAAYGDTSRGPEMAKAMALHDKWRQIELEEARRTTPDAKAESFANVHYIQGYVSSMLFRLAAERALDAGQTLSGENVKNALETFSGVDTGGLTDKISFSSTDHRPQSTESIYKIAADGKLVREPPDRTISLQSTWLGW